MLPGPESKILPSPAIRVSRLTQNDPALILPDAEISDVAPKIFAGAMMNTGQVCVAIKRVFVHESKYEEMVDAMKEQARKLGAELASSISKNLDLLVTGEKASASKVAKAEKAGVQVLSEADYLALIG